MNVTCTEMYIANTGDPRLGPSGFLLHLETDVVATPRVFGKAYTIPSSLQSPPADMFSKYKENTTWT